MSRKVKIAADLTSAMVWVVILMVVGAGQIGCSDQDTPKLQSSLADEDREPVGSAPPGGSQLPKIDPKQNAREAFDIWAPLVTTGQHQQAREICTGWLKEEDIGHHSEAHKCLANIAIADGRLETPEPTEPGEMPGRAPISREAVNLAVQHYEAAIASTPFDSDAHLGRMDVLIISARYREANVALEQTLTAFSSRSELNTWFKLLGRFQRLGAYEEGLAFLEIIEKHHPLDHRVISNLGAYYAILGNHEKALAHSKRAVSLSPDDPINKWNLARMYDYGGDLQNADVVYQEALALLGGSDPKASCDYAKFLVDRVQDRDRACEFAQSNCLSIFTAECDENDRESG